MNATATAIDFAQPHHRRQRAPAPEESLPTVLEPIKALTDDIAKDALRTATLYGNTVKERNDFAARLNEANARIQQFEIKVSEQRTTIESLTTELSAEKAERIRLAAGIEQIAHAVTNLAARPEQG